MIGGKTNVTTRSGTSVIIVINLCYPAKKRGFSVSVVHGFPDRKSVRRAEKRVRRRDFADRNLEERQHNHVRRYTVRTNRLQNRATLLLPLVIFFQCDKETALRGTCARFSGSSRTQRPEHSGDSNRLARDIHSASGELRAMLRTLLCGEIFASDGKPEWSIECPAGPGSPDTCWSRRAARKSRCSPCALDGAWQQDLSRVPSWPGSPPPLGLWRTPAAT